MIEMALAMKCQKPPEGWWCSRDSGHEGPCAARRFGERSEASVRSITIDAIDAEMARARTKFPGNGKLLAALVEEVGELAKALLQRRAKEEIVAEAIQVAVVAIRIAEEGDSDFLRDDWDASR